MIGELTRYMLESPDKSYDVVVGCDSSSSEEPSFPVVVVVLKQGEGGRFFIRKIKYPASVKKFYHWRERIYEEVMLSCKLALIMKAELEEGQNKLPDSIDYQLRYIHADIGENGKTKDMIKEVAGIIRGSGFEPKIKPESYVASYVADRYS